ncbi:MAG TPA: hypothetical protein VKA54_01130, partial [Gemmatimonadaceae bacterium]|nr:hypothetical protein [Gemmatimonadaceae bacterium]
MTIRAWRNSVPGLGFRVRCEYILPPGMGHPAMDGMITYVARVLGEIHYRPGAWDGVRVGVFRREGESETQIGEYERNYPSLFDTFHPFRADGRGLALYSPHYTGTRLLELPSCRDI